MIWIPFKRWWQVLESGMPFSGVFRWTEICLQLCMWKLIPKTIGNRKGDCAWSCLRWQTKPEKICKLQSTNQCPLRTLQWFVLCNLQIFSGCVCHLEQLHTQSPFLFPIVFGIILIPFFRYWLSTRCPLLGYALLYLGHCAIATVAVCGFCSWALVQKLSEIEKEIVREVVWGDKQNLRKSANCKAQISVHSAHCNDLCFAICRFSQVVFVTSNNFTHSLLFYFR